MNNRLILFPVVALAFSLSTQAASEKANMVRGGDVTSKVQSMPKWAMPAEAKAAGASGPVKLRVEVDENGRVISAQAISGHATLLKAATAAARQARFKPTKLRGQPVKVTGVIQYNFVSQ